MAFLKSQNGETEGLWMFAKVYSGFAVSKIHPLGILEGLEHLYLFKIINDASTKQRTINMQTKDDLLKTKETISWSETSAFFYFIFRFLGNFRVHLWERYA